MKTFVIQEKFTGYADITIQAETEEEAISLYNRGYYKDSNYDVDQFEIDQLHKFVDQFASQVTISDSQGE